jgi:ribosomal protein S6--L-glutamate ligase
MKLVVISVEKQWEIEEIRKAAKRRGHQVKVLHPREALIDTTPKKEFDIALFRPLAGAATQGRALASAFHAKGIPLVDEKLAFEPGGNKFKNYWAMKQAGLHIPKTLMLNKAGAEEAGRWKGEVVVKPLGGKRGEEIYKCKAKELAGFVKKLKAKKEFLLQEFIPVEKELRVLVVGKKVIGAFKKESADWRHNVARGAIPVKEKVSPQIKKVALKAAKATRLEIAGVDLALSQGKWFVFETNRSPQFKGFQKANPDLHVAEEIVSYLEKKAKAKKKKWKG